ncbi:iron-containing alcohol dehydrogenase [Arsenicitalea aurantiaca]|uniref:Alcohol dehydrogenase 2 n=1 Tax=Arsenicitalea aurantiaca TaxID=1783274 RepID=A0A433XAL6_9HYPH|nr:iron-containing alcohol dehydrogenase [Arsenicitalea aurantiaca]RUT31048.1 iron-containing alcohol dehydrogenase [Arsenicitalea aurantiaca]
MALITYLTRIQFEAGAVRLLGAELEALGASAPLIVTDRGIVAAGIIDQVIAASGLPASVAVFDGTPENPTEAAAHAGVEAYRAGGCDSVVAVGGGSAIDLAKAVALLVTHDGPLAQYAAILGGLDRITADKPPVIAVPTTAGTGSEVGRAALLTLEDGRKLGFISPHMIPSVAICDPELTTGLPAYLTAATGMDTVTHCIETYLSPRYNPVAEAIALDGLGRAVRALPRAVADGRDIAARTDMMMAALQGGLTFQKGLGAVHSMSHPLGGLKTVKLHHGTLNAVLLPAVLTFNRPEAGRKYEAIARVLGLEPNADLADALRRFAADLGLPATLSAMGVPRDVLPEMAEHAVRDHSTATNPRKAEVGDFLAMLEASY